MTCQMTGLPPISTNGLGFCAVSSESRVPSPPARMATGGWARGTVPACPTLSRDNAPFDIIFVMARDRCLSFACSRKRRCGGFDWAVAAPITRRGQPAQGGVEKAAAQKRLEIGQALIAHALEVLGRKAEFQEPGVDLLGAGVSRPLRPEPRQLHRDLRAVDAV